MSWKNKITLEDIEHTKAREVAKIFMDTAGKDCDCISKLEINADAGYKSYKLYFTDGTDTPVIFDDGHIID